MDDTTRTSFFKLIDLGAQHGGSIGVLRKYLTEATPLASFFGDPKIVFIPKFECLGIDIDAIHVEELHEAGHLSRRMNLNINFPEEAAEFYSAFNLLEHLDGVHRAQEVLKLMLRQAKRGVILRLSSFETDETGEGALLKHGLRWSWTRWHHHTAAVRREHVRQVLASPEFREWRISIRPHVTITNADSPLIVPERAPHDCGKYEPEMGNKPIVIFDPPLVPEWDVWLARV